MKLIVTIFPVLLFASCAPTAPLTPEQKFASADKDGSGTVSRTEATNMMIANAFAMYDRNSDGFVAEKEYVDAGGSSQNFSKVNKSGSGKISLAEAQASSLIFNTFVVSFDEADANKDRQVTLKEYTTYIKLRDAAVR